MGLDKSAFMLMKSFSKEAEKLQTNINIMKCSLYSLTIALC